MKAATITVFVMLGLAAAAQASPISLNWTGYGENVPGSSKCPIYKMTIDVVIDGRSVTATFQQEGRTQRHFEATLDAQGRFKTEADVQNGKISASGTISAQESRVLLDGYCKFGGKLIRR